MAELAAIGLAGNIITFIEFSIDFGKLVRSVSQTHGGLPRELEECHEYIAVVATWLESVRISPQTTGTTVEQDKHLEEAIQRCSQTAVELLGLLGPLAVGSVSGQNSSLVEKTRAMLGNVKKAGKILWKRERIAEIRDKLRLNRDNVHFYIGSRTGRYVKKLVDGQIQIENYMQLMNQKMVYATARFHDLELQNEYLVMQNTQLIEKVDVLFDIVTSMNRDRRNKLVDIFDYMPPKPSLHSVAEGMRIAATTVFDIRRFLVDRHSRPKVGGRQMMLELAKSPSPPENRLSVPVIVKPYGTGWHPRTILVNLERGDFEHELKLSEALQRGQEPVERLLGLRCTTRVTFIRFHHDERRISILESRDSDPASDLSSVPHYLSLLRSCLSSNSDPPVGSGAGGRQEELYELYEDMKTQGSVLESNHSNEAGDSQSYTEMPPMPKAETHNSNKNCTSEEWGVYVERDWSVEAKLFFYSCVIAGTSRTVALRLRNAGVINDDLSLSLCLTVSMIAIVASLFLCDDIPSTIAQIRKPTNSGLDAPSKVTLKQIRKIILVFCLLCAFGFVTICISKTLKESPFPAITILCVSSIFIIGSLSQMLVLSNTFWIFEVWHWMYLYMLIQLATSDHFASEWKSCFWTCVASWLSILYLDKLERVFSGTSKVPAEYLWHSELGNPLQSQKNRTRRLMLDRRNPRQLAKYFYRMGNSGHPRRLVEARINRRRRAASTRWRWIVTLERNWQTLKPELAKK